MGNGDPSLERLQLSVYLWHMDTSVCGAIDICQSRGLAGWAMSAGKPAPVSILLNGSKVGSVEPTIERPDVCAAYGVDGTFGFTYGFPRALTASDKVEVLVMGSSPLPPVPHELRIEQLAYGIDRAAPALEIGPCDSPFLDRQHFNVLYADHASKHDLIEKYQVAITTGMVNPHQIVDPDIVWTPGTPLDQCTGGKKFDNAVASHAIEHVANPIRWLNEIAACLSPGGRINLAVPEKTRTFDHDRRLSNAADLIEAFHLNFSRPGFRAVFDHISNVALLGTTADRTAALLNEAFRTAAIAQNGHYFDVHCHVFTHDSFRECWSAVEKLSLCRATLDRSWPAVCGSNEFIVSFVVADRSSVAALD